MSVTSSVAQPSVVASEQVWAPGAIQMSMVKRVWWIERESQIWKIFRGSEREKRWVWYDWSLVQLCMVVVGVVFFVVVCAVVCVVCVVCVVMGSFPCLRSCPGCSGERCGE